MDETYDTYVDDECFGNHEYHDDAVHDTDHDTDDDVDDDAHYDTDDGTDDGGRRNLYRVQVPATGFRELEQGTGSPLFFIIPQSGSTINLVLLFRSERYPKTSKQTVDGIN